MILNAFKSIRSSAFEFNKDRYLWAYRNETQDFMTDGHRLLVVPRGSVDGLEFGQTPREPLNITGILSSPKKRLIASTDEIRRWAECHEPMCNCQIPIDLRQPLFGHGPYSSLNGIWFNRWLIWSVISELEGSFETFIGGATDPLHFISDAWRFAVMPIQRSREDVEFEVEL